MAQDEIKRAEQTLTPQKAMSAKANSGHRPVTLSMVDTAGR